MERETPLGKLRSHGTISQAEYNAGVKWAGIYHNYLHCIGAPGVDGPMEIPEDDDDCKKWEGLFHKGRKILEDNGKRVFHAVNAIAVYEEPEEYGDSCFKISAARIGLAALAENL